MHPTRNPAAGSSQIIHVWLSRKRVTQSSDTRKNADADPTEMPIRADRKSHLSVEKTIGLFLNQGMRFWERRKRKADILKYLSVEQILVDPNRRHQPFKGGFSRKTPFPVLVCKARNKFVCNESTTTYWIFECRRCFEINFLHKFSASLHWRAFKLF